jgi:hypothetical protein
MHVEACTFEENGNRDIYDLSFTLIGDVYSKYIYGSVNSKVLARELNDPARYVTQNGE